MTNDELIAAADSLFISMIETNDFDLLDCTSHERTLICARIAAKFAEYAADELDL